MQAMKINAKINGINQKLQAAPFAWMNEPYIVMGNNMCTKQALDYFYVNCMPHVQHMHAWKMVTSAGRNHRMLCLL